VQRREDEKKWAQMALAMEQAEATADSGASFDSMADDDEDAWMAARGRR
jgi:hypothetical protein